MKTTAIVVRSLRLGLYEGIEPGAVRSLCVAVEQESCVIWVCQPAGVQFLEVGNENVNALGIKKLRL